jgi:hypothetical protein
MTAAKTAAKRLSLVVVQQVLIEPNKWQTQEPLILLKDRLPIRQRDPPLSLKFPD